MTLTLYNNVSSPHKIHKVLQSQLILTGDLRNESSIIDPVILIETTSDIVMYNYCYITEFSRYYFIRDIISVRTNLWRIICHVDVLMSFSQSIDNQQVVLDNSESSFQNKYIQDSSVFVASEKTMTEIKQFESGFSQNGEFILITAGGLAT